MNIPRSGRIAALALSVGLFAAACGNDADSSADTTSAPAAPAAIAAVTTAVAPATDVSAPGTIVDVAAGNPDFSVLVEAVGAAGLVDTLKGAGPFTVFAPTNQAFVTALTELGLTKEQLLANKELLTSVLTYHVVPGKVLAADVTGLNGKDVATVNGAKVNVSVADSTVKINNATVTATDIVASNGVIHVIDAVLLPPVS